MMSCILLLYIAVSGASATPATDLKIDLGSSPTRFANSAAHRNWPLTTPDARQSGGDPDALYARRDDLSSAQQAAAIWSERLRHNTRDFESAWKLARARYWLGNHASAPDQKTLFDGGVRAARTAISAQPNRPEGHFWLAANLGALAEALGGLQGLKSRNTIKNELLTVLKIDPAFQEGSADRALGRWYYKVPAMFGGTKKKSEEHLRRSLTYNPNSTVSHYFLAETLVAIDRKEDARAELQKVIDAPLDPEWAPEDREWKDKARKLLASLGDRS